MRRSAIKFLAILAAASLFGGCGFQLRGQAQLPFVAAYVDAPAGSSLGEGLRQSLSSQKKLAEKRDGAPVLIKLSSETRNKNILSLSGGGKVREFRLEYRVEMSAFDAAGEELIAASPIYLTREFSYNDDQVLAKASEETALNRGMEQDALRQALRRLSYIKR
ncbi:MAG: LPS assembly lipoprotein LptE [Gallionellaceae bacterium]|nr:LPS assembly lipoprotein LptE [Gallionellaceae bacterium]